MWRTEFDQPGFSGVTFVNDLLFISTLDGQIHTLSRGDGTTVSKYQTNGGINAMPAVAGDTLVWLVGRVAVCSTTRAAAVSMPAISIKTCSITATCTSA